MIEKGIEYCDECGLPVADPAAHGCADNAPKCGAQTADCFDCFLECRLRALASVRKENLGLREALERIEGERDRVFKVNERLVARIGGNPLLDPATGEPLGMLELPFGDSTRG